MSYIGLRWSKQPCTASYGNKHNAQICFQKGNFKRQKALFGENLWHNHRQPFFFVCVPYTCASSISDYVCVFGIWRMYLQFILISNMIVMLLALRCITPLLLCCCNHHHIFLPLLFVEPSKCQLSSKADGFLACGRNCCHNKKCNQLDALAIFLSFFFFLFPWTTTSYLKVKKKEKTMWKN